ncbi:hypothetical protein LTR66_015530 [Elasticomyces elasticus]|nr:hypothetical protein LTR66_015530 [Elasticomyces elasticus]
MDQAIYQQPADLPVSSTLLVKLDLSSNIISKILLFLICTSTGLTLNAMRLPQQHFALTSIATFLFFWLVTYRLGPQISFCIFGHDADCHNWGTVNSTLGFGAIYVVSRADSPRQSGLLSAANITGLDITIPSQPLWSAQDIIAVQATENSSLSHGSALAWLGHINVLDSFLNSMHETALIIEDDVDWDVRLRQKQISKIAGAVRQLIDELSNEF